MKKIPVFVLLILAISVKADHIQKLIQNTNFDSIYKKHHKVLAFDSIAADVKKSGLSYVTRKQLFYANDNRGAADLHKVTYNYDPLSAYVEIKKALIYRKNGTIEKLDSTHFYDYPQPARMIYWGARQKMVQAGHLNPGDALYIEVFRKGFTYALLQSKNDDNKYVPPMKGHYYDIVKFYEPFLPIHQKVFHTSIPKTKKVQYKHFNGDFEVKTEKNKKQIYSFKLDHILPINREPNMVGTEDVGPKVLITTSPDWEAKSKWFYGVNEDFGSFESTPEINTKVNEILKGASSELDSIARLTHWVADEIRYSGLSMGEGEGYTLHKGEMTFTDRCGVCKDKAGMLITMLRAAGFESYAAMTMAGSKIEDIPADQFNHSITIVKRRNGEYQVLDPTWVPFVRELWSSREQQQNYLMGLPGGADLMITDVSAPKNHYLNIENNGTIDENGTLTGKIHITAEGQSDAAVRGIFTHYYKSQWRANLEKELLNVFPQATIKNIEYSNPYDYRKQPVSITYHYEIPDFAISHDNKYVFNSFVNQGFMKHNRFGQSLDARLNERKFDYKTRCSQKVNIQETYTLPAKIKKLSNSEQTNTQTKIASAQGQWTKEKNQVSFELNTRFEKRKYKAASWPDMLKVLESIQSIQNEPIITETK